MSRTGDPHNMKAARQVLAAMSMAVSQTSLDERLQELVKIRASQINGCAACLTTHVEKAIQMEIPGEQIAVIPAWREAPWFSDRERAALAWTEVICAIGHRHVSDDDFAVAKGQFDEPEIIELTMVILAISNWNKLNAAFATTPQGFRQR